MPRRKQSNQILEAAIEGFEAQKLRIQNQIAELRRMLSGEPAQSAAAPQQKKGRRKMSAAARKHIGEAQRKRWAAARKESAQSQAPETAKPKRKISAAGRRRMVEATKKRWGYSERKLRTRPRHKPSRVLFQES